jgi:SAM-dependent methyltransferase
MRNRDVAKALLRQYTPFRDQLRVLKRYFVPYVPNAAHSDFALNDGLAMLAAIRQAGGPVAGRVLEIGTGWTPIIPMLFHLGGANAITLTDLDRLYDETSAPSAVALLRANGERVQRALGLSGPELEAGFASFAPDYLCPWNPAGQDGASVDLVISRAVLEHIPPGMLTQLFGELRRIIRPGGYMCHSVDNTDHWQHGPHGRGLADFLRHDSAGLRWKIASLNKHGYVNRLRHSDYLAAAADAGWEIVLESAQVPPETLAQVQRMQDLGEVAPQFRHYAADDLAATATLMVVRH